MNKITANLSILLADFFLVSQEYDCTITGLALDSRLVHPGNLFFAYPGYEEDGRKYIEAAVANGAVAIVCEGEKVNAFILNNSNVVMFVVPKVAQLVGLIAAKFYDYPTRKLTVIGVTGTNGKTSITQFIAQIFTDLGQKCGVVGTLGVGFPNQIKMTGLTTPDAITIQSALAEFVKEGAKAVAIEVSSQGMAQNRLQGVDFKIAVFTNLTRDHLDYHKNMQDYAAEKRRLFFTPGLEYAVINTDDEYGVELLRSLPLTVKPFAYTTTDVEVNVPQVYAKNIKISPNSFNAEVMTPWGNGVLQSSLLGRFNVSNLLAVLSVLCISNIELSVVLQHIAQLKNVKGRMQTLGGGKLPLVVVDFAHTPDALEKSLLALREHCRGKLWCVFGCGGDKDRGKRSLMGQIAERYSDQVIITSDNPRSEDPQQISDDIVKGLLCPWAVEVEHDRGVAIFHAIDCAVQGDVVLLAGKGHEDYQIIGKNKIPFNDVDKALEALQRK